MTEKQKSFVYKYWNKTELGRKMIASSLISDSDLLFLIPNNIKKMQGLPISRMTGKKKRKQKEQRKRFILLSKLFDIIANMVEETLCSKWSDNEFFGEFVDIKNFDIGDKNKFDPFNESKIVTVPTSTKPIRMYLER